MIAPIIIAVAAVILGGISMFFSSLYGERYLLYRIINKEIAVIIIVEIIHQTTNNGPWWDSIFWNPEIKSWTLPVSGMESKEVAIPITIW